MAPSAEVEAEAVEPEPAAPADEPTAPVLDLPEGVEVPPEGPSEHLDTPVPAAILQQQGTLERTSTPRPGAMRVELGKLQAEGPCTAQPMRAARNRTVQPHSLPRLWGRALS